MFRYNITNATQYSIIGGRQIVNVTSSAEIAMLLQKGIAAARSGRTIEARKSLHSVVQADPGNEMAWLWLSGLATTNEHKRACLERVLQANPENAYARASLVRLQDTPQTDADALDFGLDFAPSEYTLTT